MCASHPGSGQVETVILAAHISVPAATEIGPNHPRTKPQSKSRWKRATKLPILGGRWPWTWSVVGVGWLGNLHCRKTCRLFVVLATSLKRNEGRNIDGTAGCEAVVWTGTEAWELQRWFASRMQHCIRSIRQTVDSNQQRQRGGLREHGEDKELSSVKVPMRVISLIIPACWKTGSNLAGENLKIRSVRELQKRGRSPLLNQGQQARRQSKMITYLVGRESGIAHFISALERIILHPAFAVGAPTCPGEQRCSSPGRNFQLG
ncbi:hypothetical protein GGR57DRAFT_441894 [Xylariaceae sp. FL1272]|nr:hypothetical protein GGR57DRAFT_441894 [Xylariaceae sp. FL1272]